MGMVEVGAGLGLEHSLNCFGMEVNVCNTRIQML